jgi:hypothetical protein
MFDFTSVLKFDNNGLVDVSATEAEFSSKLGEYAALQKADTETTAAAVAAVWDAHPNTSVMALDSLATLAAMSITKNPGELATVKDRCADHIRHATALYKIARGRNGGVSRVVAQPAPQS